MRDLESDEYAAFMLMLNAGISFRDIPPWLIPDLGEV